MITALRRFVLSMALSFTLAVESVAGTPASFTEPPPIVYRLDHLPQYGRRRPARKHHARFNAVLPGGPQ